MEEAQKLMVTVPLKDYTELVAAKAAAEVEIKHLESERLNLVGQIYDLKHQIIGMKGDDLK
jgi:hypothetical protein